MGFYDFLGFSRETLGLPFYLLSFGGFAWYVFAGLFIAFLEGLWSGDEKTSSRTDVFGRSQTPPRNQKHINTLKSFYLSKAKRRHQQKHIENQGNILKHPFGLVSGPCFCEANLFLYGIFHLILYFFWCMRGYQKMDPSFEGFVVPFRKLWDFPICFGLCL